MPTGNTYTDALNSAMSVVGINQARAIQEYDGVMTQLVDRVRLGEGMGDTWREVSVNKLTASNYSEQTRHDSPQQLTDDVFTITPTGIVCETIVSDTVMRQAAKNVTSRLGALSQNAIERKKDEDGLVVLDSFTSLGGAGTTLATGIIAAAVTNIRGNTTEPWKGPVATVLHSFQIKDLWDELVAGIGTYPVPGGATATVFKGGFNMPILGATVFPDDNLGGFIDSSADVKGGAFASGKGGAIVLCQEKMPWQVTIRDEELGDGASKVIWRDRYAYAIRQSVWGREVYSDATAPTS